MECLEIILQSGDKEGLRKMALASDSKDGKVPWAEMLKGFFM